MKSTRFDNFDDFFMALENLEKQVSEVNKLSIQLQQSQFAKRSIQRITVLVENCLKVKKDLYELRADIIRSLYPLYKMIFNGESMHSHKMFGMDDFVTVSLRIGKDKKLLCIQDYLKIIDSGEDLPDDLIKFDELCQILLDASFQFISEHSDTNSKNVKEIQEVLTKAKSLLSKNV